MNTKFIGKSFHYVLFKYISYLIDINIKKVEYTNDFHQTHIHNQKPPEFSRTRIDGWSSLSSLYAACLIIAVLSFKQNLPKVDFAIEEFAFSAAESLGKQVT